MNLQPRRWAPYAVYLLLTAALAPFYRWLISPDEISYLSIAQQYASGHLWEAVNAYWGVFWSWLLTPLLLLNISPPVAARLLTIASGGLTLWGVESLLRTLAVARPLPWLVIAAVMSASMALARLTPDLLVAALLIFYFVDILRQADHVPAWRLGLWGGVGYLTKSYLLYLFPLHFTLMQVFWFWRDRKVDLRRWTVAMGVFLSISGLWIGTLSTKYGRFTTATNGAENLRKSGPDSPGYFPVKFLNPPSSEHAVSPWQDPDVNLYSKWNRFESARNFRHQLKLLWRNWKLLLALLSYMSVLWLPILLVYIFNGEREGAARNWIPVVLSFALIPVGYMIVLVQERYIWAMHFLLLAMAAVVCETLLREVRFRPVARLCLPGLLLVSFLPGHALVLRAWAGQGNSTYETARQLQSRIPRGSRIASCGGFEDSLSIAYQLGAKYHGIVRETIEDFEANSFLNPALDLKSFQPKPSDENLIAHRLRAQNVQFVLVWANCENIPESVLKGHEIIAGELGGLRVFNVEQR